MLGMKLIGYDPYISIDAAWRLPKEVQKANSIEELVERAQTLFLFMFLC